MVDASLILTLLEDPSTNSWTILCILVVFLFTEISAIRHKRSKRWQIFFKLSVPEYELFNYRLNRGGQVK
uniref:ATP synthase F0 subunit 8 n=1 Tax=Romanomermis culicivorax TaxID=13658 RepID=A0A915JK15_ROMCU